MGRAGTAAAVTHIDFDESGYCVDEERGAMSDYAPPSVAATRRRRSCSSQR